MTDDKTRAEFETKTPVPNDVKFNEQRNEYVWRNFQTTPAPFNEQWESFCDGWQAAKERYGQWSPIESAPKDGSHIIVCKIGLTHDTRGHDPRSDEWKRIVFEEEPSITSVWWVSSARFENGKWRWSGEALCEPTHWMSVPPVTKEQKHEQ